MTDVTIQFSGTSLGFGRLVARLRRSLSHIMMASEMFHTLDELPDAVLRDMGLVRGEIPFVANGLASRPRGARGGAVDRFNWSMAEGGGAARLP